MGDLKIGSDGLNARTSRDYIKKKKPLPNNQGTTTTESEDVNQENATRKQFMTQRDIHRELAKRKKARIAKALKEREQKQESEE